MSLRVQVENHHFSVSGPTHKAECHYCWASSDNQHRWPTSITRCSAAEPTNSKYCLLFREVGWSACLRFGLSRLLIDMEWLTMCYLWLWTVCDHGCWWTAEYTGTRVWCMHLHANVYCVFANIFIFIKATHAHACLHKYIDMCMRHVYVFRYFNDCTFVLTTAAVHMSRSFIQATRIIWSIHMKNQIWSCGFHSLFFK